MMIGAGAISWSVIVFLTFVGELETWLLPTLSSFSIVICSITALQITHTTIKWTTTITITKVIPTIKWITTTITTTHHILDSSTREEPIKEAIPVPEDVGEDQVPEGHKLIMENSGGKNKVPGSGYLAFDLRNHKRPR